MPVARGVVASLARAYALLRRKAAERMAPGMSHIDDSRKQWSEGRNVVEIARMIGHDRKTNCVR